MTTLYESLRPILTDRYAGPSYGYSREVADSYATERIARLTAMSDQDRAQRMARVIRGELRGCENCGDAATYRNRCGDCRYLPSDDI